MKTNHISHIALLALAGTIITPHGAFAQTVDYGSLQSLFGEPVTTSATGKPQKASDAPVDIEIVTAEQIRRMGVSSIPEVLGRVPGLINWQATRSYADVGVRGQNTAFNPTLLVLVNGRQVYVDSYGYTNWPMIPVQLEEIRQIEVVKGPTTALYGFNAVSGVVNIITYNPKYDNVSEAGITAGTGDYGRTYGFKTLKLSDNADIRVSGSLERFDEFDPRSKTPFASQSTFQDAYNRKIMADSLVQLSDKTQLRLEGSYSAADNTDTPTSFSGIPDDKFFWSGKASLTSDTDLGLVETNLYTNTFRGATEGTTPGASVNQIMVAQLQDLFKIGTDHTFRLQAEVRHNTLYSAVFVGPEAKVMSDVVSTGGMWNWEITPTVEITNALRLDHLMLSREGPLATAVPFTSNDAFDQNLTAYSVNSGIVWKATNLDTLRASYGRGIEAPSLFNFGILLPVAPGAVVLAGDPNLNPVIVNNYEVGYDRLISAIDGKFRSSVFYKKTDGILTLGGNMFSSGGQTVLQSASIGDSATGGIELGLAGKIGPQWTWDASYIYQNTVDDFTPYASSNPSPVPLHYQDTVPHHVVKAHVGYATGPWASDLFGEAASHFDAVNSNGATYGISKLDGYYTLGARVGYTFENAVTIALSGSDLSQARTADNYGLENERRVYLTLSKRF